MEVEARITPVDQTVVVLAISMTVAEMNTIRDSLGQNVPSYHFRRALDAVLQRVQERFQETVRVFPPPG